MLILRYRDLSRRDRRGGRGGMEPTVHSNVISSQVDIHARYGGVVPEVASRQHMLQIIPVVKMALKQAQRHPGGTWMAWR